MELIVFLGLLFMLFVVLPVAVVLTLVLVGTRSFKRANRVAPDVPSQVPNLWRWSMGYGARLHRRLQRIAGLARSARAAAGAGGVEPPRPGGPHSRQSQYQRADRDAPAV